MADTEVKFTEDEMKIINSLQNSYVNVQNSMGQVEVQIIRLEQQMAGIQKSKEDIQKQFLQIQNKERDFVTDINKKYGDGNLNLETGVFTPSDTETEAEKTL